MAPVPVPPGHVSTLCVSLEGNIGAGKTTLLRFIEREFAGAVATEPEPVERWTAAAPELSGDTPLGRMYNNEADYGRAFQMYALATKLRAAASRLRAGAAVVVFERSPLDRRIFPEMNRVLGVFNDFDNLAYGELLDAVEDIAPGIAPRHHIYLRTSVPVCAGRIAKRGRTEEGGVDTVRLSLLHQIHEGWLGEPNDRVLVLDGDAPTESHRQALDDFFTRFRSPARG